MAKLALDPAYRPMTVREFLDMDIGDAKAELVDGCVYMMAGGSAAHAAIAANLIIALGIKLRGTGCRPYGSDFAVRTDETSIRFPDVSVYCNNPSTPENDDLKLLGDPRVIFEVLSPSTASNDQIIKLAEYRALEGVDTIVFVDPDRQRVRTVQRTGVDGWADHWIGNQQDLPLPSLNIYLGHDEIFRRN